MRAIAKLLLRWIDVKVCTCSDTLPSTSADDSDSEWVLAA
jgi:hypothetical protein